MLHPPRATTTRASREAHAAAVPQPGAPLVAPPGKERFDGGDVADEVVSSLRVCGRSPGGPSAGVDEMERHQQPARQARPGANLLARRHRRLGTVVLLPNELVLIRQAGERAQLGAGVVAAFELVGRSLDGHVDDGGGRSTHWTYLRTYIRYRFCTLLSR